MSKSPRESCHTWTEYPLPNTIRLFRDLPFSLKRRVYPDMRIVGNAKTLQMLAGYYGIADNTLEVKEGDTLDLGGGLSLAFYFAPMVHWPEVMVSYCPEHRTLFSADAFGTFGTLDGGITDSQVRLDHYWDEMRRYYACIVGKYGVPVQKALAKLGTLPIETICSTHGPVWQREIPRVLDIYDRLSRYAGERGVVLAYGSMYGNTEQLADEIARALAAQGVGPITVYNLSTADISHVCATSSATTPSSWDRQPTTANSSPRSRDCSRSSRPATSRSATSPASDPTPGPGPP